MSARKIYFWDSCVFIAFLNEETQAYDIPSIEQFLDDARSDKCVIYSSTIAITEVRPRFITRDGIGTFEDFLDDMAGAIVLLDVDPNIAMQAGHIRDLPFNKNNERGREMATPDAIMLASALYLTEEIEIAIDAFHTFDKGKKRGLDGGRGIPLIGFHEWCEGLENNVLAQRIVGLNRNNPIHPESRMFQSKVVAKPNLVKP